VDAIKAKLEAFQGSKVGLFLKKFTDDQATNLAALLAWGTLSTLLPLLLGILAITGLVLRDPQRVDQISNTLLAAVPQAAAGPIGDAIQGVRHESAAPASIIGLLLLLYNGSSFFSNMASVFDQAFHVNDRNIVLKVLVSVAMLIICSALLIISILALGFGSAIDTIAQFVAIGPILGRVVSWSISILSTLLLFLLIYRILPNKPQTWAQALPGTLLSTVLFFVILLVFPLYVSLFPPNHAYAIFGIFLVLTFWLYLLGLVFVLGAEVNAFLQEPSRSVALAEATEQAQRGKAAFDQETGQVQAETRGRAPALSGSDGGPGSQAARNDQTGQQGGQQQQPARRGLLGRPLNEQAHGQPAASSASADHSAGSDRVGFGGRVIGLVGLVVAALLLRGRSVPEQEHAHS
jgi:membrane protein